MNGPEHYRVAERMLKLADEYLGKATPPPMDANPNDALVLMAMESSDVIKWLTKAQVHATLALVAAVAEGGSADWAGIAP